MFLLIAEAHGLRMGPGNVFSTVRGASLDKWRSSNVAAATAAAAIVGTTPLAAMSAEMNQIDYSQLLQDINTHKVSKLIFAEDELSVVATTADGSLESTNVMPSVQKELIQLLLSNDVSFTRRPADMANTVVSSVVQFFYGLVNLAFPLLLILFFLGPRIMGPGQRGGGDLPVDPTNPFQMLKSIATLEMEPRTGVNFTQVAGCDEAKLELYEGEFKVEFFAGFLWARPSVFFFLVSMLSNSC